MTPNDFPFGAKRGFNLSPQMVGRRLLRQQLRQLDSKLDLFKLTPALRARNDVLRKPSRFFRRQLAMTVS
jgi:hypothetical protein